MPRSQDKRIWLAGGVLAAVLLIAVGWLAVISPKLSSTSDLNTQAGTVLDQNSALQARVAKLKRQNDKVGQLTAQLRTALAALPYDSGLPAYTRQLSSQATENKVALTSITVSPSKPATGAATTGTATTGTAPSAATSGLVAIPVTLVSTGSAADQAAFLKAIQVQGPRRSLVVSTQLSAGAGGSIYDSATMTVQLNVFSAPLNAAAQAQLLKLLNGK